MQGSSTSPIWAGMGRLPVGSTVEAISNNLMMLEWHSLPFKLALLHSFPMAALETSWPDDRGPICHRPMIPILVLSRARSQMASYSTRRISHPPITWSWGRPLGFENFRYFSRQPGCCVPCGMHIWSSWCHVLCIAWCQSVHGPHLGVLRYPHLMVVTPALPWTLQPLAKMGEVTH